MVKGRTRPSKRKRKKVSASSRAPKSLAYGDVDAIYGVIEKHAQKPMYVDYVEDPEAPMNKAKIKKAKLVLKDLGALNKKLSFRETSMKRAHQKLYDKRKEEKKWSMTPTEQKQFRDTMTAKVRNLCKHAAAALKRNSSWINELLEDRHRRNKTAT